MLLCCAFISPAAAAGFESPRKAVQAYYDALFANDFQAAYTSLSQSDREALTLEAYMRENYFDYPMVRYINAASSYKIGKIKTDRHHGGAKVTVTAPGGEDVNTFVYRTFMAYGLNSVSEDEALARILELIKEHKFEMHKEARDIMLIQDDEGWHVFFDWAYREARLQKLLEAKELSYSQHIDKLLQAKALYAEVRQMRGNENYMYFVNEMWDISRKIEHLEACIARIDVTDIVAETVETDPADMHVTYAYTLHNRNTEDVINIAIVKVELLNADGTAVFTREERISQRDAAQNKTIPETRCNGKTTAEAVVAWDGSTVSVKVVNVERY